MIDLRSDTVTRPTDGMRRAMATAEVGDDVYGEDPTVNRLEAMAAERLGHEAGLFVASGTMANVVAILTHGGRGDEMILGNLSHTFLYEGGAAAGLAGIHPHILSTEPDGTLALSAIRVAIRPDNVHFPRTRLLCLENSHNRCGGAVLPHEYTLEAAEIAHGAGAAVHLDGARLFNAAIASSTDIAILAGVADSVMFCLSKGLGAPVGSLLCGTKAFIREAHRMRKIVGGGMRQVGILAAAGIYALEHHVERLADDHANARRLAEGIRQIDGLRPRSINGSSIPETNLVYFDVDGEAVGQPTLDAFALSSRLKDHGVLANAIGEGRSVMRMATHLDVDEKDIDRALAALRSSTMGT
ncbi:MAG: low-specificity L-threonine aldolase [Candidatus Bipolaricaulota bacterium]|nr:MAG: low-specificity L-threonine aldolase [Candidatus Bipolaricaulota bacterium]